MSAGGGSLAASQGMRAATAQLAEELALRSHPETMEQLSKGAWGDKRNLAWVAEVCPELTTAEQAEAVNAMKHYSGNGFHEIHNNNPDNDSAVAREIELIDRVLGGKNTPVYKGEIYRGVRYQDGEAKLRKIIKSGQWNEKGITSFSSYAGIADNFSDATSKSTSEISVILRVPAGKNISGVPFKHMSKFASEDEVLLPSSVKNRGWTITKATWTTNKHGRKVVYLDIEENIRRKAK